MMNRKWTYYGRPQVAGLYYYNGDTYYKNLDGRDGKIIILVPGKQAKEHKVVK